jgi:hypothetical protein
MKRMHLVAMGVMSLFVGNRTFRKVSVSSAGTRFQGTMANGSQS